MPKSFEGNEDEDVGTWIFSVKEYLAAHGANMLEERATNFVTTLLSGNAVLWWRGRVETLGRISDCNTFLEELRKNFTPANDHQS